MKKLKYRYSGEVQGPTRARVIELLLMGGAQVEYVDEEGIGWHARGTSLVYVYPGPQEVIQHTTVYECAQAFLAKAAADGLRTDEGE